MPKVRPRVYISVSTTILMEVTDTFFNKLIDNDTQTETILRNCFLNNHRKLDKQSTHINRISESDFGKPK